MVSSKEHLLANVVTIIQFGSIGCIWFLEGGLIQSNGIGIIQMIAVVLGLFSIWQMSRSKLKVTPLPHENAVLITTGIYGYVRHPMYTALLLFILPIGFNYQNPVTPFVIGAFVINLLVKIEIEERFLTRKFPGYAVYVLKSKRLIPFLY